MEQTHLDDYGVPTVWTPKRPYRTARVSPPAFPGLGQRRIPARSHTRLARLVASLVEAS
jgi:hypothetical protein